MANHGAGKDGYITPFLSAMEEPPYLTVEQRLAVATTLLDHGADANDAFKQASYWSRANVVLHILDNANPLRNDIDDQFNYTKLAIKRFNNNVFEKLLEKYPPNDDIEKQFNLAKAAINHGNYNAFEKLLETFPNLVAQKDNQKKSLLHYAGQKHKDHSDVAGKRNARFKIEKLILQKGEEQELDLSQERDNRNHRPSYHSQWGKNRDILRLHNIREKYKDGKKGPVRFNFFGNKNLRVTLRYSDQEKYNAADHLIKKVINGEDNAIQEEDKNVLKYSPELKTINKHLTRG